MTKDEKGTAPDPRDLLIQGCERPWEVAVEPFRVSPRVYYVGNSWVGAYLIATSDGLILIDTTMHPQVYLVFEGIRLLGFDPRRIKHILLTHAHYDHCGGLRPLAEYSGAKVWMGKEDAFFLTERPDLIFTEVYPFGSFAADGYFADDKPIVLGDTTVSTAHTPGHTPGTTSFFIDDRDADGTVYRCALHGGIGLNTLDDESLRTSGLPRTLRDDFLRGLLRLRDREVDITLGSHPAQTGMLEKRRSATDFSAFVDPSAWGRLMDRRIGMIRSLMGPGA